MPSMLPLYALGSLIRYRVPVVGVSILFFIHATLLVTHAPHIPPLQSIDGTTMIENPKRGTGDGRSLLDSHTQTMTQTHRLSPVLSPPPDFEGTILN